MLLTHPHAAKLKGVNSMTHISHKTERCLTASGLWARPQYSPSPRARQRLLEDEKSLTSEADSCPKTSRRRGNLRIDVELKKPFVRLS